MSHQHGPNCGCIEYANAEDALDLHGLITFENLICMNEKVNHSGKKVFKTKEQKFDKNHIVDNDSDPELLFVIPFDTNAKLKSICVIATNENSAPNKLKLYINQENVDFSLIEDQEPLQEFDIAANLDGTMELALKQSKFQSVSKLIIHVSSDMQDDISVSFIGIKGFNTKMKQQIVKAMYETKPMMADHKSKDEFKSDYQIGE